MTSPMRNIVSKEIKEILRDPRLFLSMVIVPLIIFPVMGMAFGTAISSTEEQLRTMEFDVMVLDNDGDIYGNSLIQYLNSTENMTVETLVGVNETEAIIQAEEQGFDAVVVIPPNFSSDMASGNKTHITIHSILETVSIFESAKNGYVHSILQNFEGALVAQNIANTNTTYTIDFFLDPIQYDEGTVLQGHQIPYAPESVAGFFMSQSTTIPIVLMMLIIMSAQLAAVTIASEKEEKTLETLLTLPVRRTTILMGKISGVAMMALVGAVAYMGGFLYYMNSVTSMGGGSDMTIESMGLGVDTTAVIALGLSIAFALLAALSLAVLMAAFTEDVRSAQSLTGLIVIPVLIPAFIMMFADPAILPGPVQGVLYAIPFSYPIMAAKGMFTGVGNDVLFGLVYQLIFTLVVFYIAGRLFSTEKIFTAKLEFKRKR